MVSQSKPSLITNVPPTFTANPSKDSHSWLKAKQKDDNVEDGLWRIHNTLYDLNDFVNKHPGGADWIKFTKGHDITEAFITHHFNLEKLQPLLQKYRVRDTTRPRNCKLTFEEDGFYMTLKRKVTVRIPEIKKRTRVLSKLFIDVLFALSLLTAIGAQRYQSYLMVAVCALFYTWCAVSGHNFFHQRDNFRMKYFNLILSNYRDWRISHCLSHHMYPNSLIDVEVSMLEPFLVWTPSEQKTWIQRYLSYIYSPFLYLFIYLLELLKRIHVSLSQKNVFHLDDALALIFPISMYIFGGDHSLFDAFKMFAVILAIGGFYFGIIGLNAGHHHPEIVHDGDKIRDGYDWGIYTIDTIMDRQELRGNRLLALTNFGDHALHHLFPTLDHGVLPELYDMFFETLLEFEAECQCYPWFFETVKGQFQQLSRIEPMKLSSHERYLLKTSQTSKLVNGKPIKRD